MDVPEEARVALAFMMQHRHDDAFDPSVLAQLFGPDRRVWRDALEDLFGHGFVEELRVVIPEAEGRGPSRNWMTTVNWRTHWAVPQPS